MTRAKYLAVGLVLAVLLLAGAAVAFAYGQAASMMGGQGMARGQMMGSFDENKPFDLQFIDRMTMHHEGAIISSKNMIADSKRPELRQIAEDIQKGQSEQ